MAIPKIKELKKEALEEVKDFCGQLQYGEKQHLSVIESLITSAVTATLDAAIKAVPEEMDYEYGVGSSAYYKSGHSDCRSQMIENLRRLQV